MALHSKATPVRVGWYAAAALFLAGSVFVWGLKVEMGQPPKTSALDYARLTEETAREEEVPALEVPEGSRVLPLENFPDDPRLDSVGRMLQSGQYGAAELTCMTVLKERAGMGRAEFLLALAITKQKRYEEAKVHFLRSLVTEQKFIERPHTPHFLGWCHYHLGEMDDAQRRFEEHLVAVPNEPDSTFGLAVVAIAQDRTDDASRLLHAAFIAFGKDKPRDQARVLVRQSDLAMRADDPAKAEELLAQAATLAPTFPEIWAKTARVKDRLGKTAQAEIARENERKTREALTATAEGNS